MMLVGPTLEGGPGHHARAAARRSRLADASRRSSPRAAPRSAGCSASSASPRPHLAVAGLNPHAGEGGALGREEIDLIIPAIERLREEGYEVSGPHPADIMFHERRARASYDAALCMYHDQALIPLKTLHFDEGVNITLGLPIVRTSPDHGTAFDIAGRDLADPRAMIAAIRTAAECARAGCAEA